jgi:hypothetical protein
MFNLIKIQDCHAIAGSCIKHAALPAEELAWTSLVIYLVLNAVWRAAGVRTELYWIITISAFNLSNVRANMKARNIRVKIKLSNIMTITRMKLMCGKYIKCIVN